MNTAPKAKPGKTIIEEPSFAESAKQLGAAQETDAALSAILEGISIRPEGYDLIPGWEPIRIAKTDRISRKDADIPALRLWFVVRNETTVSLLYVEKIPDGEA